MAKTNEDLEDALDKLGKRLTRLVDGLTRDNLNLSAENMRLVGVCEELSKRIAALESKERSVQQLNEDDS